MLLLRCTLLGTTTDAAALLVQVLIRDRLLLELRCTSSLLRPPTTMFRAYLLRLHVLQVRSAVSWYINLFSLTAC